MRFLIDIKINDKELQKNNITSDEVIGETLAMIYNYWYNEGIVFNKEDCEKTGTYIKVYPETVREESDENADKY